MTEDELAEIEARVEVARFRSESWGRDYFWHVSKLVAELRRLQGEVAEFFEMSMQDAMNNRKIYDMAEVKVRKWRKYAEILEKELDDWKADLPGKIQRAMDAGRDAGYKRGLSDAYRCTETCSGTICRTRIKEWLDLAAKPRYVEHLERRLAEENETNVKVCEVFQSQLKAAETRIAKLEEAERVRECLSRRCCPYCNSYMVCASTCDFKIEGH